eukprot:scaffold23655_cov65-Phaeocystis_antarctica.AAC.11
MKLFGIYLFSSTHLSLRLTAETLNRTPHSTRTCDRAHRGWHATLLGASVAAVLKAGERPRHEQGVAALPLLPHRLGLGGGGHEARHRPHVERAGGGRDGDEGDPAQRQRADLAMARQKGSLRRLRVIGPHPHAAGHRRHHRHRRRRARCGRSSRAGRVGRWHGSEGDGVHRGGGEPGAGRRVGAEHPAALAARA